jgi:cephalosporin-C deacetylase-like acetyl esterase
LFLKCPWRNCAAAGVSIQNLEISKSTGGALSLAFVSLEPRIEADALMGTTLMDRAFIFLARL